MITLKRAGNLLEISETSILPLLEEVLMYYHRISYYGKDLIERIKYKKSHPEDKRFNPQMSFVKRNLYEIRNNKIYCGAGLKPYIVDILKTHSISYDYLDLRKKRLPPADFDRLREIPDLTFRYKQPEVLATIDKTEGGIIIAPTGWGKTRVIEMLLKVYPKSRILIVSPGLDLIKSTYERLLKVCTDVGRIGGGYYEPEPRVTLCSADSLHKAYLDKAELLLYDEVHTAGTMERIKSLSRFTEAKMIGFSASFPARTDGADSAVEALFGPVILRVNYDEAAEHKAVVPIKVLMVNIPPKAGYDSEFMGQVAWKRNVIWRNDYRNEVIAKTLAKVPEWLGQSDPQILCMVETLDHAYELRKFATDFKIVYATQDQGQLARRKNKALADDDEKLIKPADRLQLRKDFEKGALRKVIATHVWKQGVDFVNLQVFFRADGGTSEINNIQLPGRLSRTADGKEFGLLLDTIDRFDQKAYNRSLERKKAYEEMGWTTTIIYDLNTPVKLTETGTA